MTNRPTPLARITISYAIDNITAVHGVDFTGSSTDTLTIPSTPIGHNDGMLGLPTLDRHDGTRPPPRRRS